MSEVIGLDNLQTRLKEIGKVLSTDDMLKAAKDGMIIYVEGNAKPRTRIDTGRLRNSITTEIEKETVITGTNVEYAPPNEFGTAKMSAQPFMRPAWDEGKSKVIDHMEEAAQDKIRKVI